MKVLIFLAIATLATIASANNITCLRNISGHVFNLCPFEKPIHVHYDVLPFFSANLTFSLARPNVPSCGNHHNQTNNTNTTTYTTYTNYTNNANHTNNTNHTTYTHYTNHTNNTNHTTYTHYTNNTNNTNPTNYTTYTNNANHTNNTNHTTYTTYTNYTNSTNNTNTTNSTINTTNYTTNITHNTTNTTNTTTNSTSHLVFNRRLTEIELNNKTNDTNVWFSGVNYDGQCAVVTSEPFFNFTTQGQNLTGLRVHYSMDNQRGDLIVNLLCNQTAPLTANATHFSVDGVVNGALVVSGYSYYGCPVKFHDERRRFFRYFD